MQHFVAANPVETMLLEAQEGRATPSMLFAALYPSQVYVLVDQDPGPAGQWTDETTLLILLNQAETPVMAMFTSPARLAGWPEMSGKFRYALRVDFSWLLNGIMEGVGIVLNPGAAVGVELSPELVAKFQKSVGLR